MMSAERGLDLRALGKIHGEIQHGPEGRLQDELPEKNTREADEILGEPQRERQGEPKGERPDVRRERRRERPEPEAQPAPRRAAGQQPQRLRSKRGPHALES